VVCLVLWLVVWQKEHKAAEQAALVRERKQLELLTLQLRAAKQKAKST
jgi:hypothetical protein